jgi:hypothetical protein
MTLNMLARVGGSMLGQLPTNEFGWQQPVRKPGQAVRPAGDKIFTGGLSGLR